MRILKQVTLTIRLTIIPPVETSDEIMSPAYRFLRDNDQTRHPICICITDPQKLRHNECPFQPLLLEVSCYTAIESLYHWNCSNVQKNEYMIKGIMTQKRRTFCLERLLMTPQCKAVQGRDPRANLAFFSILPLSPRFC